VDRPEVIIKHEPQNPPAEQSASMLRRLPRWRLDRLPPPRGLRHLRLHHQRSDDGPVRPWGTELVEECEGNFIYIPAHLIHRESVTAESGEGVVV
jgi:hypothetical protein